MTYLWQGHPSFVLFSKVGIFWASCGQEPRLSVSDVLSCEKSAFRDTYKLILFREPSFRRIFTQNRAISRVFTSASGGAAFFVITDMFGKITWHAAKSCDTVFRGTEKAH
jgi:hypothetical protein